MIDSVRADLLYVPDVIREHGSSAVDRWALLWEDDEDEPAGRLIAEGEKLIDIALHTPLPERESLAS